MVEELHEERQRGGHPVWEDVDSQDDERNNSEDVANMAVRLPDQAVPIGVGADDQRLEEVREEWTEGSGHDKLGKRVEDEAHAERSDVDEKRGGQRRKVSLQPGGAQVRHLKHK